MVFLGDHFGVEADVHRTITIWQSWMKEFICDGERMSSTLDVLREELGRGPPLYRSRAGPGTRAS